MSQEEGEDDDKQYEPTAKKLEDARKRGEIPRSNDLNTAAAYAGLLLAGLALGGPALTSAGSTLMTLLDRSAEMSRLVFAGSGAPISGGLILAVGQALAPFFALPIAVVILVILAQRGFVFAPTKLAPKTNKVSPIAQAKQKFGRSGLFEFLKSFIKLMIYSVVLFIYLAGQMPRILMTIHLEPGLVTTELLRLSVGLLAIVLVIALALGGIDFAWQRAEHMRKHRMSRKEMTDEHKESEGDPAMKQQRRQKAQEVASNQMLQDVPDADVVIVNPTHYAVALKWARSAGSAPVCVAKGVDHLAARIREIATENGVPVHSDPPTARAVHATVEIGEEIRPDHYQAVAVAIRFAERVRKAARR
ncbi:EscU/YscU/HrcU family type III secretion system export apparatus switch protein [Salibaculum halophilum]|uniref:EscU/YscU/HrcU family type III secretion system export apparatus switch protein n=1 Tax=Salibaculum halophilum TaxID=1914408 RepID=UPI000A122D54|nr:flagellar type III secretion system protein FlhB [Salibaculum halophilum]